MKSLIVALAASFSLVSLAHAQTLFTDNFSSQTVGNTVSGWSAVTPTTAGAVATDRGAVIFNDSGNNVLRMYDNTTANSARVEEDFTSRQDVHLSLSFERNANIAVDPSAASTTAFYVSIGANGQSQGTQANRDLEIRLFSNGAYRINSGKQDGSGNFVSTTLSAAANFDPTSASFSWHTLDVFMFDGTAGGATKNYVGPDSISRVLDPNSFSVFIDGILITPSSGNATVNGDFGIFQSSIYSSDNNFGRLGLFTGGASNLTGFDMLTDNVSITGIAPVPEPATLSLLGVAGLAFWLRRRVA